MLNFLLVKIKNDSSGVCFGRIYDLVKSVISGSICTEGSGLHCAKLEYRKVASSRLFRLVAHSRIFRLFMKGKFDAYVL